MVPRRSPARAALLLAALQALWGASGLLHRLGHTGCDAAVHATHAAHGCAHTEHAQCAGHSCCHGHCAAPASARAETTGRGMHDAAPRAGRVDCLGACLLCQAAQHGHLAAEAAALPRCDERAPAPRAHAPTPPCARAQVRIAAPRAPPLSLHAA
jgi:hypothetical protein